MKRAILASVANLLATVFAFAQTATPNRAPWTGPAVAVDGKAAAPVDGTLTDTCCTGSSVAEDVRCINAAAEATPYPYEFWAGVEPLFWWEKKQPIPPDLITTGSPTDRRPGALGQPNTRVAFGSNEFGYGMLSGVRAFAGAWLDSSQALGVEAGGFVLEDRPARLLATSGSNGSPLLALRRIDQPGGTEDAFVLSSPAVTGTRLPSFTGGLVLATDSHLWGAEFDLLHPLYWSPDFRLVGLGGVRYTDLHERVDIFTNKAGRGTSTVNFLGRSIDSGAQVKTADLFHTRAQFIGGQTGFRGEYILDRWIFSMTGKLAFGDTEERLDVFGASTLQTRTALPVMAAGGLYALNSNIGRLTRHDFSVLPETELKASVLLLPALRLNFGYDFLYWTHLLRAGDQIDLNVDPRQVPTSATYKPAAALAFPQPLVHHSDFWAQGLSLGVEVTY